MDQDRLTVAQRQLDRMRTMNHAYHRRFFHDIWLTAAAVLVLYVLGAAVEQRIFLAIPVVALLGANQTAFDASYLTFSRHYSTRLEQYINEVVGADILVAHVMEDAYLFPLRKRKIVTVPVGGPMTWFSWMTIFYTLLGIGAFAAGIALGISSLTIGAATGYLAALAGVTIASVVVGSWWFFGGAGERRLETVLNDRFAF